MDQIQIGCFIAQMRKDAGLTQRDVAESLGISDKTVSKWERGKGLPEVSLMLPLCEILQITVNELLSARKLTEASYTRKAEENIMKLMQENQENRKKIALMNAVVGITLLSGITLILTAGLADLPVPARIALITVAAIVIAGGIAVACVLDRDTGYFACAQCGEHFVPEMKDYVKGAHTLTRRVLTCPHCGARGYCKKVV